MTEGKVTRLSKIAREFNVGISTIVDFLHSKGVVIDPDPNTKISSELYDVLVKEYSSDISVKKESEKLSALQKLRESKESVSINDIEKESGEENDQEDEGILIKDTSAKGIATKTEFYEPSKDRAPKPDLKILGKIDIDQKPKPVLKDKDKLEKEQRGKFAGEEIQPKSEKEEPIIKVPEKLVQPEPEMIKTEIQDVEVKVVGKIDLEAMNQKTRPAKKSREQKDIERKERVELRSTGKRKKQEVTVAEEVEDTKAKEETNGIAGQVIHKANVDKLSGPTVVGKIDLGEVDSKKPVASSDKDFQKKKRKRIIHKDGTQTDGETNLAKPGPTEIFDGASGAAGKKGKKKGKFHRLEVNQEDVQKQIKDTLARMSHRGKSTGAKHRRDKRDAFQQKMQEEAERQELGKNTIKVTEFVSVSELASLMNVESIEVIQVCMNMGLFVSINQRLDAETMALVADEFNYKVEFISVEVQEAIEVEEDREEDMIPRPPIVTVMGHVDHGKTKLLDYIRNTNVIAGEAGGITQHIGAYAVLLEDGKQITFLDTPGHEAFTAMRARGAQITDIAIIVIAADDGVMPQTIEAINHASAANVPIVFAINKIDKPTANPEKIKEELANMNYLVEDWGGKFQSQDVSAKDGKNVEALLEKVLLEAEMLELKANPNKRALGTVIESSLDKGRGYTATLLVEGGTMKVGDILLAGHYYGRIKAMFNERGKKIDIAGPATPVVLLGLNGAPQAGDKFNVLESDKEAREIANKREQLQREQGLRTQKHITLDEIGRRIAIGNFQELNLIVKGDVDGSIEALSDSLIKLSNEEIQVNVIHKAVGQISEGDILLAAASDAIIIGFQVRPSLNARKLAEKEEIDIRLYSIIYDAINDVKAAMEGMLSPEIKEEIVATLEILEVFKITKVGTIAGCMVKEGKIHRDSKVRVIRDGIVVYSGLLGSLKRFKDEVKEVGSGLECGLNIENFNDIKVKDIVEAYKTYEIAKKL